MADSDELSVRADFSTDTEGGSVESYQSDGSASEGEESEVSSEASEDDVSMSSGGLEVSSESLGDDGSMSSGRFEEGPRCVLETPGSCRTAQGLLSPGS